MSSLPDFPAQVPYTNMTIQLCSYVLYKLPGTQVWNLRWSILLARRIAEAHTWQLLRIMQDGGGTNYRVIHKKRMNFLQNIKWNDCSYALETHISNQCQAVDDTSGCSEHITVAIPDQPQRVEYLLDSINCADNTLQHALRLIRTNTNDMRMTLTWIVPIS